MQKASMETGVNVMIWSEMSRFGLFFLLDTTGFSWFISINLFNKAVVAITLINENYEH